MKILDVRRQNEIKKFLKCDFLRIRQKFFLTGINNE